LLRKLGFDGNVDILGWISSLKIEERRSSCSLLEIFETSCRQLGGGAVIVVLVVLNPLPNFEAPIGSYRTEKSEGIILKNKVEVAREILVFSL
jgi:hypothetical protein